MDSFSPLTTSSLNIHRLEIFTANLVIQGDSTGPYRRASDLVNRKDRDYILLDGARISQLGRPANPTPLNTQLMAARQHIHLVAIGAEPEPEHTTSGLGQFRESGVRKFRYPCYMMTDVYVVFGECYMVEGGTLENLMAVSEQFLPLTNATIYINSLINSLPSTPLPRDLVVINKDKIQAMYLVSSPSATQKLEESSMPSGTLTEQALAPADTSTAPAETSAESPGASTSSLRERLAASMKDRTP